MVPTPVTVEQLDNPDVWPPDATLYDRTVSRFLSSEEAATLAQGIDKKHLHQLVFRPLVEVVPGVLYEGYNVLSAPPKIGKTIIAHQLMMAVDMGSDWLGRSVRQGPVLFFGLEDTLASVFARDLRLAGDELVPFVEGGAGRVVVTDCGDGPGDRLLHLVTLLQRGYSGVPFGLVVVDTSPRFLGTGDPAQNAYERGLTLTAPLDRYGLRYHCAILGIHHDRKASDGDDFDAVSGGLSITGTAQCVMSLRRTRGGKTGVLSVYPRADEEKKLALEFERGAWQLSREVAVEVAEEAAGCRRDCVAYLIGCTSGATLGEIVQADTMRHHSYANIRQALQRLRASGKCDIDGAIWSAVRSPAAVHAPPEPSAPVVPVPPRGVDTPDPCDRCDAVPARVDNRSGAKWCRSCCPSLWPAVDVVDQADDVARFRRPDWARGTPLGTGKGNGPIAVWNELLERSFRVKRVQLVAHPYPRDEDVPPPFRRQSQSRGMLIHEGKHTWRNPTLPEGTVVQAIDRNGSFMGSLGGSELPIGRCVEYPGRGPLKGFAGAHLLDHWPHFAEEHFPHPGGKRPPRGEIWIATPTLIRMEQCVGGGTLEPFEVLRSWVGQTMRLEQLHELLRVARDVAIELGDEEMEVFGKKVYSLGLSTSGESGANTKLWRPEWPALVRATFHSNMHRAAEHARRAGIGVAAVLGTDELHLDGEPFASCSWPGCEVHPPEWRGSGFFTHGRGFKHWKIKGEAYQWEVQAA